MDQFGGFRFISIHFDSFDSSKRLDFEDFDQVAIRGLKGVARAAGAVRHVLRVHGKLHLHFRHRVAECQHGSHGRWKSDHCNIQGIQIASTPKEYKYDKVTGCDREKCESCYLNHPCASCCLIKPSRKNHSWGPLFVAHEVLVANHPRSASKTTAPWDTSNWCIGLSSDRHLQDMCRCSGLGGQ